MSIKKFGLYYFNSIRIFLDDTPHDSAIVRTNDLNLLKTVLREEIKRRYGTTKGLAFMQNGNSITIYKKPTKSLRQILEEHDAKN